MRAMSLEKLTTQLSNIMGPLTRFKNLISSALADIGQRIFDRFEPKLTQFNEDLKKFIDAGGLEKFAKTLISMAESLVRIITAVDEFITRYKQDGIRAAIFGPPLTEEQIEVRKQKEAKETYQRDLKRANRKFHDLPTGVMAEATAPDVPVVITGVGDPEVITRKSTIEDMQRGVNVFNMSNNMDQQHTEIISGLEDVVAAIGELNLETVISADQIKVIMAQGN